MNMKRLVLACVVVFLFVFVCDYILHGVILKNAYIQTAQLWRTEAEMKQMFGWLLLGQLVAAVMMCVIYAFRRTKESCAGQGSAYGLFVGLLFCSPTLITYAVQPIPAGIIGTWIVGDLVKFVLAGAILGAVYQPMVATVPGGQTVAA